MHSSTYEMRKSSHTHLASGKQMQHIELDTKGKPTKIGTQLWPDFIYYLLAALIQFHL